MSGFLLAEFENKMIKYFIESVKIVNYQKNVFIKITSKEFKISGNS